MDALLSLDDILKPIDQDMGDLNRNLLSLISSDNGFLQNITLHIFSAGGKRLRPAIVFLIARALNTDQLFDDHYNIATAIE